MANCLNPKSLICLDPKEIIDAAGYHLLRSRIFFVLGIIFALLGIVSDAVDTTLGLEPMSWFRRRYRYVEGKGYAHCQAHTKMPNEPMYGEEG